MTEGEKTVSLDEYTQLKQKYDSSVERSQKLEGKLTTVEKELERFSGIDLEALKAHSEELQILKQKEASTDPEKVKELLEEAVGKARSEFASIQEKLEAENKALRSQNKELSVVDRAMSKLSGLFNDDMQDFIKSIVRSSLDLNDDGDFVVKNDDGTTRYNGQNKPMTLDEFGQDLASRFPSAARASVAQGSKQNGQVKYSGNNDGMSVEKFMSLTKEQRAELPLDQQMKLSSEAMKQTRLVAKSV